jgi:hypothetical protein
MKRAMPKTSRTSFLMLSLLCMFLVTSLLVSRYPSPSGGQLNPFTKCYIGVGTCMPAKTAAA